MTPESAASSGHDGLIQRGGRVQEAAHQAENVKTDTMCSTENKSELQTCKLCISDTVSNASLSGGGLWGEKKKHPWENVRPRRENGEPAVSLFLSVKVESVSRWIYVAFPSSFSVRPDSSPGAEDQAPPVLGGPGGVRDLERGLLSGWSLVRLVHGTRDRLGGRLAPRLRVGVPYILIHARCIRWSLVHSGFWCHGETNNVSVI